MVKIHNLLKKDNAQSVQSIQDSSVLSPKSSRTGKSIYHSLDSRQLRSTGQSNVPLAYRPNIFEFKKWSEEQAYKQKLEHHVNGNYLPPQ